MLKRGKKAARHGAIQFRFNDYLIRSKLPAIPKVFGHVGNTPPLGGWNMLGNDQAGCCVVSGGEHETMLFASATKRPIPQFNSAISLQTYSKELVAQGGASYDPNNSSTDTGLDVQQAAEYRRTVGLTDLAGVVHKIDAYVGIGSVDNLIIAAYLFGAAGLGMALPNSAEDQFDAGHVWDDTTGKPTDGHYIPVVGRNSVGNLVVVTWGTLQAVSIPYISRYMDEAVAYFSTEYLTASGVSPEAFDASALNEDLQALAKS